LYCVCEIHLQHPQSSQPSKPGSIPAHTNQPPSPLPRPPLSVRKNQWDAASVSLPFRFTSQRTKPDPPRPTPLTGAEARQITPASQQQAEEANAPHIPLQGALATPRRGEGAS